MSDQVVARQGLDDSSLSLRNIFTIETSSSVSVNNESFSNRRGLVPRLKDPRAYEEGSSIDMHFGLLTSPLQSRRAISHASYLSTKRDLGHHLVRQGTWTPDAASHP